MEWREQTAVGCEVAFSEAQRWLEEVTKKRFGSANFRSALENGVLLCDLINKLKPGIIKRVNRLSTPIAGLDNVSVFLKACGKLGLNEAQLFHPGDLQDVSTRVTVRHHETSRRLKNVLITIYWLGRKAHADPSYSGPQLNFKAFEGLLGVALSKALDEASCSKPGTRDSGFAETWCPDREVPGYRREDSVESLYSVESRTLGVASDCTLIAGSEGFGSDAEAEHCFRMTERLPAPSKERQNVPAVLRKKRFEQREESGRGRVSALHSESGRGLVSPCLDLPPVSAFHQWALNYRSDSESDSDQPEPDPVQDDLASRRFRSSTAMTPANFAVPLNLGCMKRFPSVPLSARKSWVTMSDAVPHERSSQRSKSLSDLTQEPRAQGPESSTFLHILKSQHSKAVTVSLRQEQLRQYQARLRESEAKWQEVSHVFIPSAPTNIEPESNHMDLNRWKTRRRSVNSDLHRKKEGREELELVTGETDDVGEEQEQRRSLRRSEPDVSSTTPTEAFSPSSLTSSSSSMPGPVVAPEPAPAHRARSHGNGPTQATPHTPPVTSAASDHVQSVLGTDSIPVPIQRAKSLEGVFSGTPQMSAVLPRGFRRSETTSRLSTGVTPRPFGSKTSRMSAHARFYSMDESHNSPRDLAASFLLRGTDATDHQDDARSSKHAADLQKKVDEKGKRKDSAPSIHSFMSASILESDKAVFASGEDKLHHRDMRVSLNQTPDCGTDFGFQAHWDSTGARITSIRPGSPAQLCHLQAGDEIVALAGQRVAEMSYEQWKANMDAALREGKLLMDIRRISLNGHPDVHTSDSSSLLEQSESKAQVNGHHVNGFPSKAVKTSSRDDSTSTKSKGGSESAILDLQVPSISVLSSRWSWNPEEERRRQEKWQMEQEHLLQEKYRRDQERLEEAWRRDQQEAALEENPVSEVSQPLEEQEVPSVPTGSLTRYTPPPLLQRSKSPSSVAAAQQVQETSLIHNKQVQIAAAGHLTEDECDSSSMTSHWPSESYGFTKLTAKDRKKSKSTPSLEVSHKQDSRAGVKKKGRLSQVEEERLQILDEMKKKTPVLTDSSWIRQRSTCTIHKEPISVAPLRRHESLDNIHSNRGGDGNGGVSGSKQSFASSQPLSGLRGIVPYRGHSGRCSLGPGAAIFSTALKQSSCSQSSSASPASDAEEACNLTQQQNSVPAAGLSSGQRGSQELRCESDTDSSSAMPVTTDSETTLAFPSDLGALQQIGEKPCCEYESDTTTTSSA